MISARRQIYCEGLSRALTPFFFQLRDGHLRAAGDAFFKVLWPSFSSYWDGHFQAVWDGYLQTAGKPFWSCCDGHFRDFGAPFPSCLGRSFSTCRDGHSQVAGTLFWSYCDGHFQAAETLFRSCYDAAAAKPTRNVVKKIRSMAASKSKLFNISNSLWQHIRYILDNRNMIQYTITYKAFCLSYPQSTWPICSLVNKKYSPPIQ